MDTEERQVEQTLRVADSALKAHLVEADSKTELAHVASETEPRAVASRSNLHQTKMHPSLDFSVRMARIRFMVTVLPAMAFFIAVIGILTSQRLMGMGWQQTYTNILIIFICFALMARSSYRWLKAYKQSNWVLNHIPAERCDIKIRQRQENRRTIVSIPSTTDASKELEYYCTCPQDNLSHLFPRLEGKQTETVSILLYRHPLTKAPVAIEADGKFWLLRLKPTTYLSQLLHNSPISTP